MMVRKVTSLFLLITSFCFLYGLTNVNAEAVIPEPIGDIYVQDFADVLSEEEETKLQAVGRRLDDQTSTQVSVLTVASLEGTDIETFANEAFRKYKLGNAEKNNGVLLVLALNEKEIRIETGYGLEGVLPDGKAGRILDEYAIPYLKNNQPGKAVTETYQIITQTVSGEYKVDEKPSAEAKSPIPGWLMIIIIVALVFLDIKFFGGALSYTILSMLSRRGGGGGSGGPRGGGGGSAGGGGAGRGW